MKYMSQLKPDERNRILIRLFEFDIPCIIFTDGNVPPAELINLANKAHIPIFGSLLSTTKLVNFIGDFLDDQFAIHCSIHGAFVDVYGVGILFTGKSGIGKSEVALDLVERGHRLVSDDIIILTKKGEGVLMGTGLEMNKHFLEIRGLGLINISKMFGVRSIRYQKRLEVIVELEDWDEEADYDRTGLEGTTVNVLDVDIPYIKLPIIPGKNITVISEVISLHYLLKHYGYDAAKDFQDRLNKKLQEGGGAAKATVEWFEGDKE
jgi:HPr kinase/phosphorylase